MSWGNFLDNAGRMFGFVDDTPKPSEAAIKDDRFWTGGSAAASQQIRDAALGQEQTWGNRSTTANGADVYDTQAADMDRARALTDRGAYGALGQQYQATISGTGGPSQAQLALREGTSRAQQSAQSMAASSRGVAPGAALRMAMSAQGNAAADATNAGASLRAQEIEQARAGLAGTIAGQAGIDSTLRGQSQQQAYQGAQVAEQERERAAGMAQAYLGERSGVDSQNLKGQMQLEETRRQSRADTMGAQETTRARQAGGIGGMVAAAGAAMAMSDERLKTGITPTSAAPTVAGAAAATPAPAAPTTPTAAAAPPTFADRLKAASEAAQAAGMGGRTGNSSTDKFIDQSKATGAAIGKAAAKIFGIGAYGASPAAGGAAAPAATEGAAALSDERAKVGVVPAGHALGALLESVEPVEYRYKKPARDGAGEHVGVLAQDLEQTPAGRSMVTDTPRGKVVDGGKAALAALAATSDQEKRLRSLEALFGLGGGK